ncbi:hypothetical protein [Ferrovibrio sp.]|uniref:hypothetical protein n=1 Tax=Ferrovibrio sp. TaxID=1917215 RepID=UPI0026052710|nr:hypothetical protein [Ferrovibrio sp.]
MIKRRHYLFSQLNIPFFVEAKIIEPTILLRTWHTSTDAPIKNAVSLDEAEHILQKPVHPFQVNSDPFNFKRLGLDQWIPAKALGGTLRHASRRNDLFLKPISEVSFEIGMAIAGCGAWSDYGLWVFNAQRNGSLEIPFNRYLESYPSKAHRQMILASKHQITLLMLCVPFARDNLDKCTLVLKYNEDYGCAHNMPSPLAMPATQIETNDPSINFLFGVKALLPSLRLVGPDVIGAGQMASYAVELFDKNIDALITDHSVRLYLETNAGYLPHRQVFTKDGVANFNLMALGLEPGDKIKLKVGWRNYSGADEKIIAVV